MSDWLELAVIAFIIGGIAYVVFRGGQANPESTGDLGKQLSELDSSVGRFGERLGSIEEDVKRLDDEAASKADIKRLERAVTGLQGDVAKLATSAASREATLDHVKEAVDRLYKVITERGLGK